MIQAEMRPSLVWRTVGEGFLTLILIAAALFLSPPGFRLAGERQPWEMEMNGADLALNWNQLLNKTVSIVEDLYCEGNGDCMLVLLHEHRAERAVPVDIHALSADERRYIFLNCNQRCFVTIRGQLAEEGILASQIISVYDERGMLRNVKS
jgi:hypothetical protein